MAGPTALTPRSVSPPNPPVLAVSAKDVLREIAALFSIAALRRSVVSGELTRVALGVVAVVLTVIAVMVSAVAWVIVRGGW